MGKAIASHIPITELRKKNASIIGEDCSGHFPMLSKPNLDIVQVGSMKLQPLAMFASDGTYLWGFSSHSA